MTRPIRTLQTAHQDRLDLEAVINALSTRFSVVVSVGEATFRYRLDTFDHRLRAAGLDPALLQAQLAVQLRSALHVTLVVHLPDGHTESYDAATGSVWIDNRDRLGRGQGLWRLMLDPNVLGRLWSLRWFRRLGRTRGLDPGLGHAGAGDNPNRQAIGECQAVVVVVVAWWRMSCLCSL